jgi:hypothetical protein
MDEYQWKYFGELLEKKTNCPLPPGGGNSSWKFKPDLMNSF